MSHHEQHERPCPHCNERMSATAPKCLNCGRLVNEAEVDEGASGIHPRQVWLLVAVVVAITVVMVVVIALT